MARASKDGGGMSATETADVKTYTQAEVDQMIAERIADMAELANQPATEEGPHLADPEIRAAKKQQMLDAGMTAADEGLTDDMRAILEEG